MRTTVIRQHFLLSLTRPAELQKKNVRKTGPCTPPPPTLIILNMKLILRIKGSLTRDFHEPCAPEYLLGPFRYF